MPSLRSRGVGPSVTSEGALLPADLLGRISGGGSLDGLRPTDDYHLAAGVTFGEATTAAWNRVVGAWAATADLRSLASLSTPEVARLRERWLLTLFDALGYGRLPANRAAIEVQGRSYPVSHIWEGFPVHLVGWNVELDRRSPGVVGAAKQSPHSLVQELLNRSPNYLWGIVTNGRTLRLLRDSASLTRQAFVEFDLERMMEGELYADFVLLWLLCHPSRVEGPSLAECWLERWMLAGVEEGTRALEGLRAGVEKAIQVLGSGFLASAGNRALRESLSSGELSVSSYYREVLRLVYQLVFLFTCEDRGVLLAPDAPEDAKQRYSTFYSTRHLRDIAGRLRGSPRHGDLWHGLRLVIDGLSREGGIPELALPALGGLLFSPESTPHLQSISLANQELLEAIRDLATVEESGLLRSVDYRHLGAEELGGVYESLLELHPDVDTAAGHFRLTNVRGNERKTTGSYYTPASLIGLLLDSALEPVVRSRTEGANPTEAEKALLGIRILDPAAGSGHFLVAAAHRMAKHLATIRSGEEEPSPKDIRRALRDVIGRCLYAVDMNDMAVELCKISLWLESIEPGRPLTFLDAHIRFGNSLLGATPALLAAGVPDAAFEPISGDDKALLRDLRKRNRIEQAGQLSLHEGATSISWSELSARTSEISALQEERIGDVALKERLYEDLLQSNLYRVDRLTADAWCAAFLGDKRPNSEVLVTESVLRATGHSQDRVSDRTGIAISRVARSFALFHWHLEFPDVFQSPTDAGGSENDGGWRGGFDVVIGNPPWDQIQLDPQEWFAARMPAIAKAAHMTARERAIAKLRTDDPALFEAYETAVRINEATQHFIHNSGRYPLTSAGRLNSAPLFAETIRMVLAQSGRAGFIMPSGIATDSFTRHFFGDLVKRRHLVSLFDFENRKGLFPGVHRMYRFALMTIAGSAEPTAGSDFVFFAQGVDEVSDPARRFRLEPADFELLNPNTRTCPIFRSAADAELTRRIYRRVPVLLREGAGDDGDPWGFRGLLMFMMNTASNLFRDGAELAAAGFELRQGRFHKSDQALLPLYEGKMVHQFNHRYADYRDVPAASQSSQLPEITDAQLQDPNRLSVTKYWVAEAEVVHRIPDSWDRPWLIGWRDITNATNERTMISAVIPRVAVGNNLPVALVDAEPDVAACLVANLNSFVLDYVARQKAGGTHLNFFIVNQLPLLPPAAYAEHSKWADGLLRDWISKRVLELSYTASDLEGFAGDLGCHDAPFVWDATRRLQLRCELDAAFFRLYGLGRDEVVHVLGSFPIVERREREDLGEFRSARLILSIFDELEEAEATGNPYRGLALADEVEKI